MRANFKNALIVSVATLAGSAGLMMPLAQGVAFSGPVLNDIVPVILGSLLTGTAILLLIDTPVMFALRWALPARWTLPAAVWAILGSVLAISPWVALNMPGASASAKISETLQAAWAEPGVFASLWLPFIVGGGVFGWLLFPQPKSAAVSAG